MVFGTMRELLKTVADIAMAGDDAPIPVSDRRDFVEAAPTLPGDPGQAASSFTPPLRRQGDGGPFTPIR